MIAGRYSLDREIGRGGMGAVWLGRDEVLGRQVAIKRIGMAPGGSSPDLLRAEREARLAARLNHPHVVAVFDLVTEDDAQWLVMEYVEGSTLAELVRKHGALPHSQAAQVLAQVAEALAAAHDAGIVHRDVKPSNILVTPGGQVKLSDFGIARAEADASLTQTGLVTGSPAYISPEVASGRQATDLSDVWSLGATLFHALAGAPPYDLGDNVIGGLYRIVHEDPPRLDDAGWLAPVLESCMTVDPGGRWSMRQVMDFLHAGPGATPPQPVPTRRTLAADEGSSSTQVMSRVLPQPGTPASGRRARPRGRVVPVLVGVAALLLVVVGVLVALNRGDGTGQTATPTTSPPSVSPSVTASPDDGPTSEGIETFIEDYLRTASSEPAAGFQMLTPDFQAASPRYDDFWGSVSNVEVLRVAADVEDLTVAYTYRYDFDTGRTTETRTEDIALALTFADGVYLIDGEA